MSLNTEGENKSCKNCHHNADGNFCSNCGQSMSIKKIDLHFILHDLQHGFLHFDKGFFITIKHLFLYPGVTIKEFINGKWMRFFHPLSLLLLLTVVYSIFSFDKMTLESDDDFGKTFNSVILYLFSHKNILLLIQLPIIALVTKMMYKKQNYNFYEILVFETYSQSILMVANILFLPLRYIFKQNIYVDIFSIIIFIALIIRTKILFFDNVKIVKNIFLSLVCVMLNLLFQIVFIIVLALLIAFLNEIFVIDK